MRPSLWLRIYARITGGTVIAGQDMDGEVFFTVAYASPFGGMVAFRHYGMRVGLFALNDDGTVPNHYVRRWKAVTP